MDEITNSIFKMQKIFDENISLYLFVVGVLCILTCCITIIYARKLMKHLQKVFHHKSSHSPHWHWYHKLAIAAEKPILCLIIFLFVFICTSFLRGHIKEEAIIVLMTSKTIAIILAITWFCLNFITQFEIYFSSIHDDDSPDIASIDLITKVLRIVVIIVSLIVAMQALGMSVSGLLAFGGMSGIMMGFAAKDLLANIFGTILIYFDKPFAVGERVKILDAGKDGVEGVVEDIGWRVTLLRTSEKKLVYIPNSIFSTSSIENSSQMSHRRILENIIIEHQDYASVGSIVEKIYNSLLGNLDIDASCDIIVSFNGISIDGLNILIQCYAFEINFTKFNEIKQKIMTKACDIIISSGANFSKSDCKLYLNGTAAVG